MPESIIQTIYQIILLGVSRSTLQEAQLNELKNLGIDTSLPPEELVLQSLAFFQQWEKVGHPISLFTGDLPAPLNHHTIE